jgi:hypothetical protein
MSHNCTVLLAAYLRCAIAGVPHVVKNSQQTAAWNSTFSPSTSPGKTSAYLMYFSLFLTVNCVRSFLSSFYLKFKFFSCFEDFDPDLSIYSGSAALI